MVEFSTLGQDMRKKTNLVLAALCLKIQKLSYNFISVFVVFAQDRYFYKRPIFKEYFHWYDIP